MSTQDSSEKKENSVEHGAFVTTDSFNDLADAYSSPKLLSVSNRNQEVSSSNSYDERAQLYPEDDEDTLYVESEEFKREDKHVFVLSKAGKPVYSLHGNEDKLVTKMATIIGLISVAESIRKKDTLKEIVAGNRKIVFVVKEYLVLVAISSRGQSTSYLNLLLNYVHNQILCLLTYTKLKWKFDNRSNFDLRNILAGDNTDKFFSNLISDFDINPSYMLCSVRCLPVPDNIRNSLGKVIANAGSKNINKIAFALLICDNLLVCLVRKKSLKLDPKDYHLLCAYIRSSDSLKTTESLVPICFPHFDNAGYLFAFLSFLDANLCLILITASDEDQLLNMRETKKQILEKAHKPLSVIRQIATERPNYEVSAIGIPELRHFMYKNRMSAQWHAPNFTSPFSTPDEQSKLIQLYESVHAAMHTPGCPLMTFWKAADRHNIMATSTNEHEVYAIFSPLTSKAVAHYSMQKIIKWVKKEETKYVIWNSPTF